jgi:hypothetical protein
VSQGPAWWARAVLAIDATLRTLLSLEEAVLDRAMCLFVKPPHRQAITTWLNGRQRQYLPGSYFYERGLFPWEKTAFAAPAFPKFGRVLLGAAGGGRELEALCTMGYDVTAFEPAPPLVDGARTVVARYPGSTVLQASYDDLVRQIHGAGDCFGDALASGFDAVVLGWTSLSHVLEEQSRIELLQALRKVAPNAPVLVSFKTRPTPDGDHHEGRRTLRARKLLASIGIHTEQPSPGLTFSPYYGFRYLFGEGEIQRLANTAGYRVVLSDVEDPSWALLAP